MLPRRPVWMLDHQWDFLIETCITFAKLELIAAFNPRRRLNIHDETVGFIDLTNPDIAAGYDILMDRGELVSFVERIHKC